MKRRAPLDYYLLISALALVGIGLVMIASASVIRSYEVSNGANNNFFLTQQLFALIFGATALVVTTVVNHRVWKNMSVLILFFLIIALLLVYIPGISYVINGSHRWINIFGLVFQPSEIAKLLFVIYLASLLSAKHQDVPSFWKGFVPFLLVVGIVSGLVIIQPDLGTASVFILTAVAMYYYAGANIYHLSTLIPIGLLVLWLAVKAAPYRLNRIVAFINPNYDIQGISYHARQALIAVGSGGWLGLGFGKSIQKYNYLPEPMSDSIFAIISEELGFFRTALVMVLIGFFLYRCFTIASEAKDRFSKLLAYGISVWLAVQTLINLAAILGLIPLTGIPLTFISYGGTGLVVNLAAVGIMLNISKETHANNR
jgi:cell division protein FtsW